MENRVDNENTLNHMKSFDFKAQVKVTVLIEDSDEEGSPPAKIIKKKHDGEESQNKISNVEENDKISDAPLIDILTSDNKLMKENKTSFDNNVFLSEFLVRKNKEPGHAPSNGSSNCDNYKMNELALVKENNLTEIDNNDKNALTSDYKNNQSVLPSNSLEKSYDNGSDNNPNQTGDQGKRNNLNNLLETVADHLIIIIEAYFCYLRIQNDHRATEQQKNDYSKSQFMQIKFHFFNLSYCTVLILILPEEKNEDFKIKFLNKTIQRAYHKKGMHISYPLIYDLFSEMIKWSKNKQEYIQNFPARLQAAHNVRIPNIKNNATLKQHLNKPPLQPNLTNTTEVQKTNNQFTADVSKNLAPVTPMSTLTSYGGSTSKTLTPQNNYSFSQDAYNFAQSERDRAIYANPNKYPSTNVTNNQIMNPNVNVGVSNGNPPNYRSDISRKRCNGACCNTRPQPKINTETDKSCIFTSGPPGRQISINIEKDVLNRNQAPSSFNTAYSFFIATKDQNKSDFNQRRQTHSGYYERQPHLNDQKAPAISPQVQLPLDQRSNVVNQSPVGTVPHYTVPVPQPNLSAGHWQESVQNFNTKQPAPAQQFRNEPVEQQNVLLESTRSISTDSGFTSPLHFTNSTEGMNNTCQEEEAQSPILITHVTSLNPNASFIKEDHCYVCRKLTSKMCLGCFQTYYCSAECQKSDWNIHKNLCKNT